MINRFLIRFFDFVFALTGLIFLFPFFVIIGLVIVIDSPGKIFFRQKRVGLDDTDFYLWKFRSMSDDAERGGLLTVGEKDTRITRSGYVLRKYKLDELPQLINVLKGEMSFVGPRPEVRKYVDLYSSLQRKVLSIKPGITDMASIEYFSENEILGKSQDPEKAYIGEIMPAKILINMKFIEDPSLKNYFLVIFRTIGKIFSGR
jgi:lipopolysaccharide/colanic/teichoic acid biosynthesis glycosyltransferase